MIKQITNIVGTTSLLLFGVLGVLGVLSCFWGFSPFVYTLIDLFRLLFWVAVITRFILYIVGRFTK